MSRLVAEGPHTATDLARDLPITPRRWARPEPLAAAVNWMPDTGARWDRRLERLRAQIEGP